MGTQEENMLREAMCHFEPFMFLLRRHVQAPVLNDVLHS
jgi:hypothetical protein